MSLTDLQPLALPLGVAIAAIIVLAADLVLPERARLSIGGLASALLAALLGVSFFATADGTAAWGAYAAGPGTLFFQKLFLAAGLLASLGGLEHVRTKARFRQGEYYFLLLLCLLGMMLLPGARDLILLVISFELMGIPLYVLATYAKNERDAQNAPGTGPEAGIKLYLVGAASTAVTLYGMSLVAGAAGGTSLDALALAPRSPILFAGMMLMLAGFGFKLGVAPFHMWVPDTYQGAPGPFVAFLAAAPKAAAIASLCVVFIGGLSAQQDVWGPPIVALAVITMLVGSLMALPQNNVRRLLAYSGVTHAGYMLMAIAAGTEFATGMVLFYAVTYVLTNVGVFLVVHAVAADGKGDAAEDFYGLARRSPWLGLALLVFLLSLAGIPFVAGFWAKLYVFVAAWRAGLVWLVGIGAVLSVLALFYYLQVAKAAYVNEPTDARPVRVGLPLRVAIVACLLAIVGIGAYPAPLLNSAQEAAGIFFNKGGLAQAARTP